MEVEAEAEAERVPQPEPQPQPEGQPSPSSPRGVLCSGCSQPQPKSAFSKSQASKPAHKRRCKQCVSAGAMSLPGLQASEVSLQPDLDSLSAAPGAAAVPAVAADGRGVRGEAERLCGMALQHMQQGQLEEAQPLLERALEVDPRHVNTLANFGMLHLQQGRNKGAQLLFEQALEVDARHLDTLIGLGTLCFKLDRLEEARQFWRRALAVDPGNQMVQRALEIDPEIAAVQSV